MSRNRVYPLKFYFSAMTPYELLYIYYLEGIPAVDAWIEESAYFLGIWEDETISFLFFSRPSDDIVKNIVSRNPGTCLIDKYEMTVEQWHGDKIKPYCLNRLCIYPPWEKPVLKDPETIPVILDPGVVFGTGKHQTTEDCLDLICRLVHRYKIDSMLDIGTGTGLLSLGAAALGCSRIMACDFNHLAVRTCLNNIRLNRFEKQILAFQARGEEVMSIHCDLLVANIHFDIMQHLVSDSEFLNKKFCILSGLLNSEAKKIIDKLVQQNIPIVERRCPDGVWNTILIKNSRDR